jgi:hypothetical protein
LLREQLHRDIHIPIIFPPNLSIRSPATEQVKFTLLYNPRLQKQIQRPYLNLPAKHEQSEESKEWATDTIGKVTPGSPRESEPKLSASSESIFTRAERIAILVEYDSILQATSPSQMILMRSRHSFSLGSLTWLYKESLFLRYHPNQ